MEGLRLETDKSNDVFSIPHTDRTANKGSKHCKCSLAKLRSLGALSELQRGNRDANA